MLRVVPASRVRAVVGHQVRHPAMSIATDEALPSTSPTQDVDAVAGQRDVQPVTLDRPTVSLEALPAEHVDHREQAAADRRQPDEPVRSAFPEVDDDEVGRVR